MYEEEKNKRNNEERTQTAYYEIVHETDNNTDPLKPKVTIYRRKQVKTMFKKPLKDKILTY